MSTSYMFRLRFRVEGGALVDEESSSVEIDLPESEGTVQLSAQREDSLKEASWHLLKGEGYETEEEALEAGERFREILQYYPVIKRGIHVDVGDDEPTGQASDPLKEGVKKRAKERGKQVEIYDPVHGLDVYPEQPQPVVWDMHFEATVEQPPGPNSKEIIPDLYESDLDMDERSSLACSLYSAAQIEESSRATFLFLVTAIESLLDLAEKSEDAVSLVEGFIEEVKQSSLDSKERDSLLGSLGWLKKESITQTGMQIVEDHLEGREYDGIEAGEFFRKCYGIRSDLLHKGRPDDASVRIPSLANTLDDLVADLLTSVCGVELE